MSEYIKPGQIFQIPITGGELLLSPAYDVIHAFRPLGGLMLKYWNQESKSMCNVMLDERGSDFLQAECGLMVVERPFITVDEHGDLLQWKTNTMTEGDFGL